MEKAKDLEKFLHEIALLQEKLEKDTESSDHLQMMTLHAAKGLEFHTVIIAGLEENLLPSTKSLGSQEALEEERRLFYVGATRARERLVLTYAQYRNSYGQIMDQIASRFISEIPNNLIQHLDLTNVHPAKTKTLICEWLGSKLENTVITFGKSTHRSSRCAHRSLARRSGVIPAGNRIEGSKSHPWKKNQVVKHKVFGMGVVKKIERASENKFYLTIFFKSGQKRISSRFVTGV